MVELGLKAVARGSEEGGVCCTSVGGVVWAVFADVRAWERCAVLAVFVDSIRAEWWCGSGGGREEVVQSGLRSDLGCSALLWRWLALQLAFFEARVPARAFFTQLHVSKMAPIQIACMKCRSRGQMYDFRILQTSWFLVLPSINGKHSATPAGFDCINPSGITFAASNACFHNIKRHTPVHLHMIRP